MTYLNVITTNDNLNLNVAHNLEILEHVLKINYDARVTNHKIYTLKKRIKNILRRKRKQHLLDIYSKKYIY